MFETLTCCRSTRAARNALRAAAPQFSSRTTGFMDLEARASSTIRRRVRCYTTIMVSRSELMLLKMVINAK